VRRAEGVERERSCDEGEGRKEQGALQFFSIILLLVAYTFLRHCMNEEKGVLRCRIVEVSKLKEWK